MTTATKLNALALLLPLVLAHGLHVYTKSRQIACLGTHLPLLGAGAIFVVALAILVPSAWLRPSDYFGPAYHGNVFYSARLNAGDTTMRGSLHYAGTPAYLYQLLRLFPAGMGFALEIVAILGCLYAFTRRRPADILMAGFVVVYFLVVGQFATKYIRYFVILMPLTAILAARLLIDVWHAGRQTLPRLIGRGTVVAIVAVTVAHGVAFATIYGRPDPRVEAVQYVASQSEPGAGVAIERGHNSMSTLVEAVGLRPQFIDVARPFGRPEASDLLEGGDLLGYYASNSLAEAEYLIFSDDRLVASHLNAFVSQYYDAVFSKNLGFVLEKTIAGTPRLFGIALDDTGADLSWRRFDHPTVYVFRRTRAEGDLSAYPAAELYQLRTWEDARRVVKRSLAHGEFFLFEHCLPMALRQAMTRDELESGLNRLLSHKQVYRSFEQSEAYVEEQGRWRINVVDGDQGLRVQHRDGRLIP
ncbi:MAG: hypothetical protein HN712_06735 [Gemmatimonadetes bacterium]|nr:hypothetical protein [Gemmatimonadota bacterium]MBT7859991.1 hypothetical protein [Gemmatimonadota bacterium]